eukprot:3629692-Lingulodinium_polyedra.AAC.1
MEELVQHWKSTGQGYALKDFDGNIEGSISHVVWADNMWLVSSGLDAVVDMFVKLTAAFGEIGF